MALDSGAARAWSAPRARWSPSLPGTEDTVLFHTLERSAVRRARVAYPLLRDERNDVNDAETDRLRRRRARD